MRKFYSFLIAALLMPVLAFAQDNKAISVTQVNPYQCTDNMLEIPYVGLIEDAIPATRGISYSVGFWIKPAKLYSEGGQFTTAEGKNMGILFGFGTTEHTNPGQLQYGLGYSSDGAIQIIGDGGLGAASNGFAPDPKAVVDTLSLEEWSYVVFSIDNANLKAYFYVNGELIREGELSSPGMHWTGVDQRDGEDNGKWPTFHWFSFEAQGSLDEVQFYNKALSADEVKSTMETAYNSSDLIALYTLDQEKSAGVFANVAPAGKKVDAEYKEVAFGSYWGGSALVNRKGSTIKTPTFVEGRTIAVQDVTLDLPQTDGGSVTLTDAAGNSLTTGTHTVKTQTIYTVNATPAEGYALRNLYTEINGKKLEIANGSELAIVANTKVYGDFTNNFNKPTINCGAGAEYAFTRHELPVTDLENLITGETYNFTVTMTDPNKKLIEVKLNGEVLEAVDGVYSFVSAEGQTIDIVTDDKPYYTITIEQPAAGGTIKVMHGDEEVVSGTTVRENETVNFVATPTDANWVRTSWLVNGQKYAPMSMVVTGEFTLSAEFMQGVEPCTPEPVAGRTMGYNTSRSDRFIRTIDITDGENSIQLTGTNQSNRPVYSDQRDKLLQTTAGSTLTLVTDGTGVWMNTAIWGDFDFNGYTNDDILYYVGNNGDINISGTRTITVPLTAKENLPYNVRYTVDWDRADPCTFGQTSGDNGEYITDFLVMVKQPRIEATRDVTIGVNNPDFGTAEFVNIAAEGNTVTTNYQNIFVKATCTNENAVFMYWTNQNGEVVSTDAEYQYTGTENIELIANFGFPVTYTYDTELGSLSVTNNGEFIANGKGVPAGESIVVEAIPNPGYEVTSFTVNGAAVTENPVTITVDQPINIEVVFAKAEYKMNITWNGNGSVRVANDINDDELPTGTEYKNGDVLVLDDALMIWLIPGEGETIKSASVTNGDESYSLEDFEPLSNEVDYLLSVVVAGSINATAEFTGEGSAIDGIEADDANAPVEFYNLQGVRVNSENLVPGIYVRRQGSKAVKVYVTK